MACLLYVSLKQFASWPFEFVYISNVFCLDPSGPDTRDQAKTSKHGTMKHQAVLSIDMPVWKDLIETYNIKQPMIEHRTEIQTQGPGARGWYS